MTQKTVPLVQKESKKKKVRVQSFLKELKVELRKVTWTSRDELIRSTKIVLGSILFFGFSIYLVDLAMRGSLNGLHQLVQKVFG